MHCNLSRGLFHADSGSKIDPDFETGFLARGKGSALTKVPDLNSTCSNWLKVKVVILE